jgi:hypothetical protein
LDRATRGWDALACLLLAISLSALSTGLAFAAGAAVTIWISTNRWRRLWVIAIPLLLYAAWSLWAQQYGESGVTMETVANTPASIVSSMAAASAALTGTFRYPASVESGTSGLVLVINTNIGLMIGAILFVLAVWRVSRVGFTNRLMAPLVMLGAYWGSIALVSPARNPATTRYQYTAAILVLLLFGELWRGWRPSRGAKMSLAVIAVAGLVALIPNAFNLDGSATLMRETGKLDRAKLAIVDSLGDRIPPQMIVEAGPVGIEADMVISVGEYLRAADAFGSPAYPADQLPGLAPASRHAADSELLHLLAPAPVATSGKPGGAGSCSLVLPGSAQAADLQLPVDGFAFRATEPAETTVSLRRFGDEFNPLPPAPGGSWYQLRIPPDRLPGAWTAELESPGAVRVCRLIPGTG